MKKDLLSLKQVAILLGISTATVNYYTNVGLLRVAERKGNSRFYSRKDVLGRFGKIKGLRKQGYSLGLIQQKLLEKI